MDDFDLTPPTGWDALAQYRMVWMPYGMTDAAFTASREVASGQDTSVGWDFTGGAWSNFDGFALVITVTP